MQDWCCPQGHRWQWSPTAKALRQKKAPRCPVCGAAGEPTKATNGNKANNNEANGVAPAQRAGANQASGDLSSVSDATLAGSSAALAKSAVDSDSTLGGTIVAAPRKPSSPPAPTGTLPLSSSSGASSSSSQLVSTGDDMPTMQVRVPKGGPSGASQDKAPQDKTETNLPSPVSAAAQALPNDATQQLTRAGSSQAKSNGPDDVTLADPRSHSTPANKSVPSREVSPFSETVAAQKSQTVRDEKQAGQQPATGGYELLGTLGRGGMGVVYKARQVGLNRLVALKMILSGSHASTQDLERFKAEAEAIANLKHPNIVQIYDFGEREGHPFFSLEYVDGGSLQGRMEGKPLPARSAAELVEQIAKGMHFAHQHGILHRDLKPANVLMTRDGVPKITDFGLAKKLGDDSSKTGTGAILGTPSYMSPEQAEGKKEIGAAADIYSLGAVLYDTLTGRPPFCGESVLDTLNQVQHDDPVPPRRLQSKVPRDLEIICLKCLQKEPQKRYPTADELALDLRRFLNNEPIKARPVSLLERAVKWARRRPAVAALLVLLMLVLVGGFFAVCTMWLLAETAKSDAMLAWQKAENESVAARRAEKEADAARQAADRQLQATKRTLYASEMKLAHEAWNDAKNARLRELLVAQDPKVHGGPDLRGFEWFYLWNLLHSDRLALKAHTSALRTVAFRPPGGAQLASASGNGTIILWNVHAQSGPRYRLFEAHPDGVRGLAFSADGKLLASGGEDGKLLLWAPDTATRPVQSFPGHPHAVTAVAFSPDGKKLASGSEDRTIKIWDVDSGKELSTLKGHAYAVRGLAFSPDGKQLASGGLDRTVRVWDVDSGKEHFFPLEHKHWVTSVAYSPDGKHLASTSYDRAVKVWDAASGNLAFVLDSPPSSVRKLAFSPDQSRAAAACEDQSVVVWDLSNKKIIRRLEGMDGLVRSVAFSADGQLLASVTFDLHGQEMGVLTAKGPLLQAGFGANGSEVGAAGVDGVFSLWKLSDEEAAATELLGHKGPIHALAYNKAAKLWATGGEDGSVGLWDVEIAKPIFVEVPELKQRWVLALGFDAKASALAVGSADGAIHLLQGLGAMPSVRSLKGHADAVNAVVLSGDGRRLYSAGADRNVVVWDAAKGTVLHEFQAAHGSTVRALALHPDGKLLASAGDDRVIKLWDLENNKELRALTGHSKGVSSLAFDPEGRRLVSGSDDRTVKLWDIVTGQETLTLKGHREAVTGVAFSPEGARILSASWDAQVLLWDAPRDK